MENVIKQDKNKMLIVLIIYIDKYTGIPKVFQFKGEWENSNIDDLTIFLHREEYQMV